MKFKLKGGEEINVPNTINFGVTGSPKYKDVLSLLKEINNDITFEMIDQVKKNYLKV